MESPVSRRQLLGVGGTAAALSIAGCSFSNDDGESESGDTGDANSFEVTVVANVDQADLQEAREEVQAAQQEAQQQLEDGEIDQEEAQGIVEDARSDLQSTQRELLGEALSAIESHVEETEGLTMSESNSEYGVALVEGGGDALVETLGLEDVQAILDGDEYGEI